MLNGDAHLSEVEGRATHPTRCLIKDKNARNISQEERYGDSS
jgi:hypothetical protein